MADAQSMDIAALVAEHHAVVYRYAYRLSGSVADAEDLTQQVFLAAQQHLAQLRDAGRGRGWLLAILRNCYLKNLRRRWPVSAATLELDIEEIPDDLPPDQTIDREQFQAALDALAPEFRIVLLLFYFDGRSYREIADELGLPIGTVMSRLSRAKRQLRGRLLPGDSEELAVPALGSRLGKLSAGGR